MKKFRLISLALAVVLAVTAFVPPVPATALAPQTTAQLSVSPAGAYGCSLAKQTPMDGTKMRTRQDFDAVWTIKNTGNAVWHASATSLVYISGARMQTRTSSVKLTKDVGLGKKVSIAVDMNAPRARGTYTTIWALYSGSARVCTLTLTVNVNR